MTKGLIAVIVALLKAIALTRYADHRPECAIVGSKGACTCGFSAALEELVAASDVALEATRQGGAVATDV